MECGWEIGEQRVDDEVYMLAKVRDQVTRGFEQVSVLIMLFKKEKEKVCTKNKRSGTLVEEVGTDEKWQQ